MIMISFVRHGQSCPSNSEIIISDSESETETETREKREEKGEGGGEERKGKRERGEDILHTVLLF